MPRGSEYESWLSLAAAQNIHEIEARGDFGRLTVTLENVPSDNPRTSRLAALSAIATLDEIARLGARSVMETQDRALEHSFSK